MGEGGGKAEREGRELGIGMRSRASWSGVGREIAEKTERGWRRENTLYALRRPPASTQKS